MPTENTLSRTGNIALIVLAVIATVAALKLGKALLAPVALGLVIAVVLAPMVARLDAWHVPPVVAAFLALIMSVVLLVALFIGLGPVLSELLTQIPRLKYELLTWLNQLSDVVPGLAPMEDELQETLRGSTDDTMQAAMPGLMNALWVAPNFLGQVMIYCGTLFFFLLTRSELYNLLSRGRDRLRRADQAVSFYFVTITLINAGLGLATFLVMTAIGLNGAVLWGAAAFLLNYVLYLGPITLIAALLVAGMIQFDGAYSLLPPLGFFALNLTEAQFVTPTFVGQRLRMNPLLVFLAILFGLWLWGPVGAVVSLPILIWFTAFGSNSMVRCGDVPDMAKGTEPA